MAKEKKTTKKVAKKPAPRKPTTKTGKARTTTSRAAASKPKAPPKKAARPATRKVAGKPAAIKTASTPKRKTRARAAMFPGPESVTIQHPTQGATVSRATLTVDGVCEPADLDITLVISNSSGTSDSTTTVAAGTDWEFLSAPDNCPTGANTTIEVTASDSMGPVDSHEITVTMNA